MEEEARVGKSSRSACDEQGKTRQGEEGAMQKGGREWDSHCILESKSQKRTDWRGNLVELEGAQSGMCRSPELLWNESCRGGQVGAVRVATQCFEQESMSR